MENPKLRIESDGFITEVYINGIKVDHAIKCSFYAEPLKVECEVEKQKTNEAGNIIIENYEIIKESIDAFNGLKSEPIELAENTIQTTDDKVLASIETINDINF